MNNPMPVTTIHTSEPYGDSVLHYWELRGPRGAVSLSAVETSGMKYHEAQASFGRIPPALPAWQRAVAGGLTDEAVFEQLQPLFAVEYGEVTA